MTQPTSDASALEARLAQMHVDWTLSNDATLRQRDLELEDLRFEAGAHWSDADLAWRKRKNKPAFTMDLLSGHIAQITNQPVQRIVISPVGHGADPTMAEYWQGICRRVENLSNAEAVYKWGRLHAIKMGRGFWRIRADVFSQLDHQPSGSYDASVFQQDLRIEPILYQHSVYEDPRCRMLDSSDMRFCIITEDVTWDEFKRLYPRAERASLSMFQGAGNCPPDWASADQVRVAEYYWIEDEETRLCLLRDGRVVEKTSEQAADQAAYPPREIVREHTFRRPRVKWLKASAVEVLDAPLDVPGRYIPVVKIVGERRVIDGVVDCRGIVRMAKDPMRLEDFMETRLAETVDQAAYDTWLTEESTVEDFADEWDNIHLDRPARLRWRAQRDIEGRPLPEPRRVSASPDVTAIAIAAQRATMALRAVMGVPDVTPDELRPEQSGRAIKAREQQQSRSTSHYADATADGIRHTARIILSMGRVIYDVPRILRIVGADEQPAEIVPYAGAAQQMAAQQMATDPRTQQVIRGMLDITAGDFDVSVAAGRGYQTGRQEAVDSVTAMVQAFPPMAPKAIPIILKNSDFPGAAELAKSLGGDEADDRVPKAQVQQMQQQGQQIIDQLTERLKQVSDERARQQAELASKEKIASGEQQVKLQLKQMELEHAFRVEQMKIEAELRTAHVAAEADMRAAMMRPEPVMGGGDGLG